MNGNIFNIQRYSIRDGPGIRTTVFLKGCNLGCLWCHNPESQNSTSEIMTYEWKCVGCGKCIVVCPFGLHSNKEGGKEYDRDKCRNCGICADKCVSGALELCGRTISAGDVIKTVVKDKIFYDESGGGVTFSGGEPLLQIGFLLEMLELCKKIGIQTAVDTAGNVPFSEFEKILPYTDLFLYDFKAANGKKHAFYTGVDNTQIISNLETLGDRGGEIIIRVPVIPGVNDTEDEASLMAEIVGSVKNVRQVELLRYNRMGGAKYSPLGRPYLMGDIDSTSMSSMLMIKEKFLKHCRDVRIT